MAATVGHWKNSSSGSLAAVFDFMKSPQSGFFLDHVLDPQMNAEVETPGTAAEPREWGSGQDRPGVLLFSLAAGTQPRVPGDRELLSWLQTSNRGNDCLTLPSEKTFFEKILELLL